MKRFLFGLCVTAAAGLCFTGCEKSVQDEAQDVREAQQDAVENVKEEQRDAQDAAVEGAKDVQEEKRELEDAKAREAERNNTTPPPVTPPAP